MSLLSILILLLVLSAIAPFVFTGYRPYGYYAPGGLVVLILVLYILGFLR